jgi:lauroyl/myristoyl acyltransferase
VSTPSPSNEPPLSRWKSLRYRVELAACRLLAWFIPRLSRRNCLRLSWALGTLAYRVDGRGRSAALGNLECVFGDRYSPAERARIATASYRNFVRTMLDLFWGQNINAETYANWVMVENVEPLIQRLREEKRGAIFMCLHQGNWEWTSLVSPFWDFRLSSVAENFKNPLLTALFKHLREHTGAAIIPQENSLVRMLKIVLRGGVTGMLIDLNLRPTQAATVVEAFRGAGPGLLMCVPVLHAVLGQRGKALLVPLTTRPHADGRITITLLPPLEPAPGATLQEITQQCWDSLEPTIVARPEEWLWAYKHFRYRPRDAARTYPAYSNESSKFEKLRKTVSGEAGG